MKKKVVKIIMAILFLLAVWINGYAQSKPDSILPVRGFCISAPKPGNLDEFVNFINTELAPRHINTLILRVDYNYKYKSHPELRDSIVLSQEDVKKIVKVCKKNNIRIIPQVNLLGCLLYTSDAADE